MKFLLKLPILLSMVYAYNLFSNDIEDVKKSAIIYDCAQAGDGAKLPVPNDCSKFVLCDGDFNITLSCRSTQPHFYRCNSTCVDDMSACNVANCDSVTTTTLSSTTTQSVTTQSSTVSDTEASSSTTTTTTTKAVVTTTTTKFNPPTVPIGTTASPSDCSVEPCVMSDCAGALCNEQCTCVSGTCVLNTDNCSDFECNTCTCIATCDCADSDCLTCQNDAGTC